MTIAAVLAVFASTQVAAATLTVRQHGLRHVARARVDDVVHAPSGPSPAAVGGSRRGDGARDDGDDRVGFDECLEVVVADGDPPATRWSRAGDADVPAQADQHATARRSGGTDGDPVGGQGLRRGAEVELDADRHEHLAIGRVPPHSPPPGGRRRRRRRFGEVRVDRGEVAVVAQGADSPADRRVHEAVGQLGGTQRDGDRLGQQRTDDDPAPGLLVHGGDLRVRGEPAARRVDRHQLVAQDVLGGGEPVRVGDDELGRRAQRRVDRPVRARLADHDAPDDAWRRFGDGAATCGAWTGGDSFRWRLVDGATVGAGTSITGAGASSTGAGAGTTASAPPPSEPDDVASGSGAPAAAGGVEPANMTPKTTASAVPPAALHPVTCRARRWPASRRSWGCTGSRCAPGEVELIDGISLRLSGDARIGVPVRTREWPQVL